MTATAAVLAPPNHTGMGTRRHWPRPRWDRDCSSL